MSSKCFITYIQRYAHLTWEASTDLIDLMFSYRLDLFKSASCRKINSLHLTEVASYEDSLP